MQEGKTALHHAVYYSSIDRDYTIVQMLIDLGADVNLKENVCIYINLSSFNANPKTCASPQ